MEQHDEVEPIQIPQTTKSNKTIFLFTFSIIVINLTLGYIFINKTKNINNTYCYWLTQFALHYGLNLLVLGLFLLVIVIPCLIKPCINQEYSDNLLRVIISYEIISQIIFQISLTISYFLNQQCEDLSRLVLIYLIIVYSIFFFGIAIVIWLISRSDAIDLFKSLE